MNIGSRNCALSFEVFPPRKNLPIETIYNTIDRLIDLKPESISVTYGAAGNDTSKRTFDIAGEIKKQGVAVSYTHLTLPTTERV